MGIPPTGKQVEFRATNLNRISDGKMVEAETVAHMMAMMHQIGAA